MSRLTTLLDALRVRVYRLATALKAHARAFAQAVTGRVERVARLWIGPVVKLAADIATAPLVRSAAKTGSLVLALGIGVWTIPGAVVAAGVAVAKIALLLVALELWLRWSTGSRPAALRRAFRSAAATGLLWAAAVLFTIANTVAPSPDPAAPRPAPTPVSVVGEFVPQVVNTQTVPPTSRRTRARESSRNGLA